MIRRVVSWLIAEITFRDKICFDIRIKVFYILICRFSVYMKFESL